MNARNRPAAPGHSGPAAASDTDAQVLRRTRLWLDRAVIGLNLCPFAKAVRQKRQIRLVVSRARTRAALAQDLAREALHLRNTDPATTDTTLLIHPRVLRPFARYNEFLDVADGLLEALQLSGVLQIASFHPRYRFADASARDVANCTNRSPYPMLHLLREDSLARAVAATPDASRIYERNIERMRALGWAGWQALLPVT